MKDRGASWWLPAGVTLFMLFLVNLPYLLGYLTTPDDMVFAGLIMNPEDSQTYFAKMLQGYRGAWLYSITFTAEPHDPAFVGGFYLFLGHVARWLGVSVMGMWHIARNVADVGLLWVTFNFVRGFVPGRKAQTTAYLIAIFGSGLGWVLFLFGQNYWLDAFPVDFKMPEAHLFFTTLTFPHVATGTAMLLLSLQGAFRILYGEVKGWWFPAGAGLLNLLIVVAYPFLIYLLVVTNGLNWLYLTWQKRAINWRKTVQLALTFLIPLPLIGYYVVVLSRNPVFQAWDLQAGLPSPPLPHYLVAFGLMLLMGLVYLVKYRPRMSRPVFLWLWVLAVALLVYAPLRPQRRFVQGVHVALAIFTALSFHEVLWPWLKETRPLVWLSLRPRYTVQKLEGFTRFLLLLFMGLSNVYLLVSLMLIATLQKPYPMYRPVSERVAVEWLDVHAEPDAIILGGYQTGNYIAAQAGNPVLLGHWAETMDFEQRQDDVDQFFQADTSLDWREGLLTQFDIAYVWHGPNEQGLGDYAPSRTAYLTLVYENEDIAIYAVELP